MTPDKGGRRRPGPRPVLPTSARPSPDDAHEVVYFARRPTDDPKQSVPGREFLKEICPPKVRALMMTILREVASAPPHRFVGGSYWEAMHGTMTKWFEIRVDGPQRKMHYRLFCRLDYEAAGSSVPRLVVITGLVKRLQTTFSEDEYAAVRALGDEYFATPERSIAQT